jgi:periplasmic divalent cation tolerance protein
MPETYATTGPNVRVVLTTESTLEDAERLCRTLVEEKLVACATLIPSAHSIYHWEGQVETSTETMVLLKTVLDRLPALQARLMELHSYQTPEFLVLQVEAGSQPYLDWIESSLRRV